MAASSPSIGKLLITLTNLSQSVLAFIFDYSETHVKNPRWPPHARFHNGQTMSLGVLLAVYSTYLMFRPKATSSQAYEDMFSAAVVSSFYFVAGVSAILYPGTDWHDPEFEPSPQKFLFPGFIACAWIGWGIERRRLHGLEERKKTL